MNHSSHPTRKVHSQRAQRIVCGAPFSSMRLRQPGHTAYLSPHCAGRLLASCGRSEEHTSELQSQSNLVCRLLLEKKKKEKYHNYDDLKCEHQSSCVMMYHYFNGTAQTVICI